MKCKFINDIDMDVSKMADDQKPLLAWKQVKNKITKRLRPEAYLPAGTVYEHPDAPFFVDHGLATAADEECEKACTPMTAAERTQLEQNYRASALGIEDPDDRQLFFDGVIAGYERIRDQVAYLPGPNYEKWKADQAAKLTNQKESDI